MDAIKIVFTTTRGASKINGAIKTEKRLHVRLIFFGQNVYEEFRGLADNEMKEIAEDMVAKGQISNTAEISQYKLCIEEYHLEHSTIMKNIAGKKNKVEFSITTLGNILHSYKFIPRNFNFLIMVDQK